MASDMKEAKEGQGPLKSAMTSPESSKTPQGKEVGTIVPRSRVEKSGEELLVSLFFFLRDSG